MKLPAPTLARGALRKGTAVRVIIDVGLIFKAVDGLSPSASERFPPRSVYLIALLTGDTPAGWDWTAPALFGVLISATDPVSVIAAFKKAGIVGRLRLLVEAESLLNDGTAAMALVVALIVVSGGTVSGVSIAYTILTSVGGGILCGAAISLGLMLLSGRNDDHLVEFTLTTLAAYGSFLVAEHFHFSGVLASLTAGLIVGNSTARGSPARCIVDYRQCNGRVISLRYRTETRGRIECPIPSILRYYG